MGKDEANFVKISTYSDMEKRERFVPRLDPENHRLVKILGEYHFTNWIECGLSNCRKKHGHGILIATEDGIETNIGNCCGAREFPDQFDSVRKTFIQNRAFNAQADVINEYLEKAPGYQTQLNSLWYGEYGGWWADQVRDVYLQQCPPSVQSRVVSMVSSGGFLYREVHVEDDDENALDLGYRRTERIDRQSVGVLAGSQALMQTPKTPLKAVIDIIGSYKALTVADTIMTVSMRRKFANEVKSIPAKLSDAEKLIEHARTCFAQTNIGQLVKIADGDDRDRVRQMLRTMQKVPPSKILKAS